MPDVLICPKLPSIMQHPSTALLVIEVANTSLRKDHKIKQPLYGGCRVDEYWIVNLTRAERTIEVYTEPGLVGYERLDVLGPGQVLRPTRLPGVEIPVDDIPWPAAK